MLLKNLARTENRADASARSGERILTSSPKADHDMTDTPAPSTDRKRRLMMFGGAGVVLLVLVAVGAWWFIFRDDSPAAVDTAEAAEARQAALDEAAAGDDDDGNAEEPAGDDGSEAQPAPSDDISGTWAVDTTIGTFDETCLTEVCNSTFVGFRIDEELANIGAKTVVGRTPDVTGTMALDGTTITSVEIDVDMTTLITDDSSRNGAIRNQAIETALFPDASFSLTSPIDLGSIPVAGEQIQVEATGELTLHGVTRTETIPLTAELQGDIIVVFGQLGPILLADYDIAEPRAAVVLSVEDNAIMELQLFFTRS